MPASLYVVSTPIGNLDDITLRALKTLKAVGLVAAEDTRRTGNLLRHFGIDTPSTSFHQHNERQKLPQLIQKLVDGTDIALVSDAGTPLVADPGQRLIAAAIEKAIPVVPIPGASAVLAALTASGLPADAFVFAGFVPSKSNTRKRWFQWLDAEARVVVFFEAPHRIQKTLLAIGKLLVDRPIIICRELTKLHEQVVRTRTSQLINTDIFPKGEFTVVLGSHPAVNDEQQHTEDKDIIQCFYHLTNNEGASRRAALTQTAHKFGLSTKYVYRMLERLKSAIPS